MDVMDVKDVMDATRMQSGCNPAAIRMQSGCNPDVTDVMDVIHMLMVTT